jgi:hypothetical protein
MAGRVLVWAHAGIPHIRNQSAQPLFEVSQPVKTTEFEGYCRRILAVGCLNIGQTLALFRGIYSACEIVATRYIYRHQHIRKGSK